MCKMTFVTELCSVTKLGTLLDQLARQICNQAVTAHAQCHSGCILLRITTVCTVCLLKVVHRNTYIHNTFNFIYKMYNERRRRRQ